jgi:hypothetical protein
MPLFIDDYSYDPTNLWISKLQKTKNERYERSDVYINLKKFKKVRIKTPFLLLPYGASAKKNTKLSTITAVLNPLTSERKKFVDMIDRIDNIISERISMLLDDDYTFINSVTVNKKEHYKYKMNINLPQNKDGSNKFFLYNKNKIEQKIKDITPRTKIVSIIELYELYVDHTEKTYRITWNVEHGKLFPEILTDENCLENDLEDESDITINKNLGSSKEQYKVKCPNCEHKIELTININVQGVIDNYKNNNNFSYVPNAPDVASNRHNIPFAPPPPGSIGEQPKFQRAEQKKKEKEEEKSSFVPNLDDILDKRNQLKKVVKSQSGKKKTATEKKHK